ncbi:MAG: hypothetical protein M0015_19645 [Betaproteobacteria bacterium]|nr:hypothetical protein [Betaproteobacteria bacterium]
MSRKRAILLVALAAATGFLAWRFLRPLNIFTISPAFERPIDTRAAPPALGALRAEGCGRCHQAIYAEWRTSMHSRAWTDPYFQADWRFDGGQQVCKNCHTPLDRQQPQRVLGFRDRDKWDPILAANADYDAALQHQGVTCAACHLRDGKIVGPYANLDAPHPTRKLSNPNEICLRCHVVQGARWDTFYRFPPCGTAAEIAAGAGRAGGRSGEYVVKDVAALGCVQCHMPLVKRPLAQGGAVRPAREHLWRGGHDPRMVAGALDARLVEVDARAKQRRAFELVLTNVGAAHFLPTGTPDRHLTIEWRLLDSAGAPVKTQRATLERLVMWRPFIVDLRDTRLAYREPRSWRFEFRTGQKPAPSRLEVTVRYHLLHESRRRRIDYQNREPIDYPVYVRRIDLAGPAAPARR